MPFTVLASSEFAPVNFYLGLLLRYRSMAFRELICDTGNPGGQELSMQRLQKEAEESSHQELLTFRYPKSWRVSLLSESTYDVARQPS